MASGTGEGREGRHDPDGADVVRLLDGWIRSERAFRGRQVWRLHTGQDGTRIDRVRYLILRELARGGPRRLTDLAEALTLTRSNASRIVDSLVRNGLVDREVLNDDRRVMIVTASDEGLEMARQIDGRSRKLIADRLRTFTAAEVKQFSSLYERFAVEVETWSEAVAVEDRDGPTDFD